MFLSISHPVLGGTPQLHNYPVQLSWPTETTRHEGVHGLVLSGRHRYEDTVALSTAEVVCDFLLQTAFLTDHLRHGTGPALFFFEEKLSGYGLIAVTLDRSLTMSDVKYL